MLEHKSLEKSPGVELPNAMFCPSASQFMLAKFRSTNQEAVAPSQYN